MADRYTLHAENPQVRTINIIVDALHQNAVMLYPTDTVYAIGCDLLSKEGQERIRSIRKLPLDKPLTFIADSLSSVSEYAHISDSAYQILRRLAPGPYTFLLPASKQVPKLVLNPKRKTTGIRIPNNIICQTLIRELGNPLISMSAKLPNRDSVEDIEDLFLLFDPLVDIIVETESDFSSAYNSDVSTMIDLTDDYPSIVRPGLGLELAEQYI